MTQTDGQDSERWVTLRDANAETGASISALRKWYRAGTIRSEEREGPHGVQRYVWLADVYGRLQAWAEAQATLGRSVPHPPPRDDTPETPPPAGMMLVPLEAWQRTLDTVAGGMAAVHDAGRELAEARELVGVERTKAEFLGERLVEVRAQLDEARRELDEERARPVPRRRWWGGRA